MTSSFNKYFLLCAFGPVGKAEFQWMQMDLRSMSGCVVQHWGVF